MEVHSYFEQLCVVGLLFDAVFLDVVVSGGPDFRTLQCKVLPGHSQLFPEIDANNPESCDSQSDHAAWMFFLYS